MTVVGSGLFDKSSQQLPVRNYALKEPQLLHNETSQYQQIIFVNTRSHGTVLISDGMMQTVESDEHSYHEFIAFLPLLSHPNPRRVLIVGGGNGGVAREVAKYPLVETIDLVEIDRRIVELSKIYLPFMAEGLNSPKLNLHIYDGIQFMKNRVQYYDVIITDSLNLIGPNDPLYQKTYFELMKRSLRPGGIVCLQADIYWGQTENTISMYSHCKNVFATAAYATHCTLTYPIGFMGFVLGSLNENTNFENPVHQLTDQERNEMKLRHYTNELHKLVFTIPSIVTDKVKTEHKY